MLELNWSLRKYLEDNNLIPNDSQKKKETPIRVNIDNVEFLALQREHLLLEKIYKNNHSLLYFHPPNPRQNKLIETILMVEQKNLKKL